MATGNVIEFAMPAKRNFTSLKTALRSGIVSSSHFDWCGFLDAMDLIERIKPI